MKYICHELIDRFSIAAIKHLLELVDAKRNEEPGTAAELTVEQEAIRRNMVTVLLSSRGQIPGMAVGEWLADITQDSVRRYFAKRFCSSDQGVVTSKHFQVEESNLERLFKMASDPWLQEVGKATSELAEVNVEIAKLEGPLRRHGEAGMSVQDIANCAIAVRNANERRLELKNQIRLLIDPELE